MRLTRLTAKLQLGRRRNERSSRNNADEIMQNIESQGGNESCGDECASDVNRIHAGFNVDRVGDEPSIDSANSSRDDFDSASESDSDSDDGSEMELPSGFLEFLSNKKNHVDDQLSTMADKIHGDGTPLLQIKVVREFIYDQGAMTIANALLETSSSCPRKYSASLITKKQVSAIAKNNANIADRSRTTLPPLPPCHCASRHLREIILSRCHIGVEGACAIANAISNSCTSSLKSLDLSSNSITGMGASSLADCMVTCYSLGSTGNSGRNIETLVLSSNPIGTTGAFALANALGGERSEGGQNQKMMTDVASANRTEFENSLGFCSLKNLHVSGCQLNDDDAVMLGNALLPQESSGLPSLPPTNKLILLNLHKNNITLKGMEFLYSVIHNKSPDPTKHRTANDSDLQHLQSVYCQSNHIIELGVIVDYGTRDFNYGNFFDQEEDEELLVDIRNIEMSGMEPTERVEQLKLRMVEKLLLQKKMMHDMSINRQCALALKNIDGCSQTPNSTSEKQQNQILRAAAWRKISQVLEEKLRPCPMVLPRRQDEYGKYLDDDFLGISSLQYVVPMSSTIRHYFTALDLNLSPLLLSWMNNHLHSKEALAMVFDIVTSRPGVCDFHCANDTNSEKL